MGMIKQFMDMKRILVLGGFCCLVILETRRRGSRFVIR